MGKDERTPPERLKLGHLATYAGVALIVPVYALGRLVVGGSRTLGGAWTRSCAKLLLGMLGGQCRVLGQPCAGVALYAGNHLSWLDPVVVGAHRPVEWITSTDVGSQSVLGTVTRWAGCRFVDRSGRRLAWEMKVLGQDLLQGVSLAFFPEATTGDGRGLLPFRTAFFGLAEKTGVPIQLFVLRYQDEQGRSLDAQGDQSLYYWGKMSWAESLKRIIQRGPWQVVLEYGPLLDPSAFAHRKEMAEAAWNWIHSKR